MSKTQNIKQTVQRVLKVSLDIIIQIARHLKLWDPFKSPLVDIRYSEIDHRLEISQTSTATETLSQVSLEH